MSTAVLIGAIGVLTISTLRRKAFTARQLGQYRLKQRLGSGGMGEVYLAEHRLLKRPCVVKVIHPEKAGDPRTLARFEAREIRATPSSRIGIRSKSTTTGTRRTARFTT